MDVYTYSWMDSVWTETVTRVHEDELDPVAMQTTRRSAMYNRIGNLIEQRTELMTAAGVWEQIDGAAYEYSVNGKETKRTTFNGLITTSEWAGTCCGKSSETAPDGTRTTFTYDDNGRLIVRTVLDPNPIETHIGYDAIGRQIISWTTNRVAHLGTTPLRTTYDALGRVTSRTDNLGNTTPTPTPPTSATPPLLIPPAPRRPPSRMKPAASSPSPVPPSIHAPIRMVSTRTEPHGTKSTTVLTLLPLLGAKQPKTFWDVPFAKNASDMVARRW
jgi:YD repeat-containing protein